MLAILETGHREAEDALVALKAGWVREDEETAARRQHMLEAHAQGARDRDAKRVELGGYSLIEAEEQAEAEAHAKADAETQRLAAERLAKADAETKRLADEAIERTKAELKVAPVPADPPRAEPNPLPGGEAQTSAASDSGLQGIDVKPAEAVRSAEMPAEKA